MEKIKKIWANEGPRGIVNRASFFMKLTIYRASLLRARYTKQRRDSQIFEKINKLATTELTSRQQEVTITMRNACRYIYGCGVEGDIAEFGTCSARSAVALASCASDLNKVYRERNRSRKPKHVHFFDSFEGLPEAKFEIDQNLAIVQSGTWGQGTCKDYSAKDFKKVIRKYLNPKDFDVHVGWFKDTVSKLEDGSLFALVHVDGDLYESAIDVLEGLFSRKMIAKGCLIAFDDWHATRYNEGEQLAFKEICAKYDVEFSDEGEYAGICRKFIINNYNGLALMNN